MKLLILSLLLLLPLGHVRAQDLTLPNVIQIAQENSYDAKRAEFSFLASYWTFRSFKAQLLPAVNLSGGLMNYDRSFVSTRDYATGQQAYVANNTLSNHLMLSVDQQIAATGGTVSLQSYLYRLDQFTYDSRIYNSQPARISYHQPLRAFNALKWEKKTAPLEYEIAKREYATAMQDITVTVTDLFFAVLTAQTDYQQSLTTLADRETLYGMAKQRLELGTTTKNDVLQMELSLLNAQVAVSRNRIALDDARYALFSYLRLSDYDNATLIPPYSLPDVCLNTEEVIEHAIANSPHTEQQRLAMLEAQRNLAQAKAGRGLQVSLNSELGFMQTGPTFGAAYNHLRDNEIIGLTLSLPIFDWGVKRGRVRVAESLLEVTKTKLEQEHDNYLQDLRRRVLQFNGQPTQCRTSLRAQDIAEERYAITKKRYEIGAVSVTDLNTAQQELEAAQSQYIQQLHTFWADYFSLQRSTLYDWSRKCDITENYEVKTK